MDTLSTHLNAILIVGCILGLIAFSIKTFIRKL